MLRGFTKKKTKGKEEPPSASTSSSSRATDKVKEKGKETKKGGGTPANDDKNKKKAGRGGYSSSSAATPTRSSKKVEKPTFKNSSGLARWQQALTRERVDTTSSTASWSDIHSSPPSPFSSLPNFPSQLPSTSSSSRKKRKKSKGTSLDREHPVEPQKPKDKKAAQAEALAELISQEKDKKRSRKGRTDELRGEGGSIHQSLNYNSAFGDDETSMGSFDFDAANIDRDPELDLWENFSIDGDSSTSSSIQAIIDKKEALIEEIEGQPVLRAGSFEEIVKWVLFHGMRDHVTFFLTTFKAYGSALDLWNACMRVFKGTESTDKLPEPKRKQMRKRFLAMLAQWTRRFAYPDFQEGKEPSLFGKVKSFVKRLPPKDRHHFKTLLTKSPVHKTAKAVADSPAQPQDETTKSYASSRIGRGGVRFDQPSSAAATAAKPSPPPSTSSGDADSESEADNEAILKLLSRRCNEIIITRRNQDSASPPSSPRTRQLETSRARKLAPKDLAEQMTMMTAAMYAEVMPEEMLLQNWTKPNKKEVAPTITRINTAFEQWSCWVSTEIITADGPPKQAELVKKFIKVAHYLYKFHNFQGLMTVLSGVNRASVQRLTRMWDLIPSKYLQVHKYVTDVMAQRQNFKEYRAKLAHIRKSSPVIPYLAVFLDDVTALNCTNDDRLALPGKRGVVKMLPNFEKMAVLGRKLLEFDAFLNAPYTFTKEEQTWKLLRRVQFLDEKVLQEKSLQQQPEAAEPGVKTKKNA